LNRRCILFIHGLGDNKEETWGDLDNILHINKSSIESNEFNNIDFKYFTYQSDKLTNFNGLTRKTIEYFLNSDDSKKKLSSQIDKISQTLRTELSTEAFSHYENISIVAHSMGGLISAKYILNELDQARTPCIDRILYICTPFVGSIFADISVKLGANSPETGEMATNSLLIESVISRIDDIESSVNSTYFFGDRDEVINECNTFLNYGSQWMLKGDHSSILDSHNLQSNYEHIKNFIINKGCSNFLENLYKRAKNNSDLIFRKKYTRKIDSPSLENLFKNHLDIYLRKNGKDANMYETMMELINNNHFNPHEPYSGEEYYVEIESNEAYLNLYWSKLLSNDKLDPHFYIGPRGSGKTLSQNVWINKYFVEMEKSNIFHVRCDVHKIYHAMRDSVKHDEYKNLGIEDYLDMQFLYIFLKYRSCKYNNKGSHKQGVESRLIKKLYNDIDKFDEEVVKGSKFESLGQFFDVQSNNIMHNEKNLRPSDRRYSYAVALMANINSSDDIDELLYEINDSFRRDIVNNDSLPEVFNRFLGSLDDKKRAEYKDEIINKIKENINNNEDILKSDVKTTLLKIQVKIKSRRRNTAKLWLSISRHVQNFAVTNNYKILRIIDGIDNIVIQDSTEDKDFFKNKIRELAEIKRKINKNNTFYFISLRDDSFLELDNKVKEYESNSVSSVDIGFHKYHHENAGNSMKKIILKRFKALESTMNLNYNDSLYGDITSYIFNEYEHKYFNEKNRFRNIRMSLRHCMFLSLHSFYEFNKNKIEYFNATICKTIIDKMFEEVFFLRSKLYVRTEETTGSTRDYKYKVFPNIFYTHHKDNRWTGLCRLRIIQLLTNNKLNKNEIIDSLSCLYPSEYIEEKIENLLNYNLIETTFSDKTNNLTYKSTNKASYLLSIVKSNLNTIYFLCLDTPLPDKYVNEDDAFSPNSYLSIFIRKINISKNTGYGNSIVKSITTFVLFIKYIHELEIVKLGKKHSNTDDLNKFTYPLDLDEIERKMIGVFKGTISNRNVIEKYFMKVGKYSKHEMVSDLSKYGWTN